jgi:aspartate 1-decarboxylase
MFLMDNSSVSYETSEVAIRGVCPDVDITGVETKEVKRIAEGSRFRTYVLVALPTGDANALQKRKDQLTLKDRAEKRSNEVFTEMDKNTPRVPLFPDPTAQQ